MKFLLTAALLPLLTASPSFAQPSHIEEYRALIAERRNTKDVEKDTAYINLLIKFSNSFYSVNTDSLLFYSKMAYGYAAGIHNEREEAASLRLTGDYFYLTGDYIQMLSDFQQALSLAEKTNDTALEVNISRNMGAFYLDAGFYDEAMSNFKKAYALIRATGDSLALAYVVSNTSEIYYLKHEFDEALKYDRQALRIADRLNSAYSAAFIRDDIGKALFGKGQYREALSYYKLSLEYYRMTRDKLGISQTTAYMANACQKLGQTGKALAYCLESYSLAQEIKNKREIAEASRILYEIYQTRSNYRSSLKYLKLYKDLSDSLFNEQTQKRTFELETKFNYEKMEERLNAEHEKENILNAQKHKVLTAVAIFFSMWVFFLIKSHEDKTKLNKLLKNQNNEILRQNEEFKHLNTIRNGQS